MAATPAIPLIPNTQSQISSFQTEDFKEAFAMFDKNQDGKITIEELDNILKQLGIVTRSTELEDMIHEVDLNGNGSIEFSEFVTMLQQTLSRGDVSVELNEAFSIFDRSGSGMITACDLRSVLSILGEKLTDDEVDELIHTADLKSDGVIDFEEFKALMLS